MNSVQRRLFRAFAESGGDLTDDEQVQRFIRSVEGQLMLLPPKVRLAVEFVWRANEGVTYDDLSVELTRGRHTRLTAGALRQRVSRGVRRLDEAVRRGVWGSRTMQTRT